MSDPEDSEENFLQRWSRRKSAAETRAPEGTEPPFRERIDTDTSAPSRAAGKSETDLPAFDPATLPPIESITAASDICAFLAPGVPEALTRAALRRVWVTDPAIRDFIGLAENQWDFTKPDSVPGFGSLKLTPELRRMVAGLFGHAPEQAEHIAERFGEPALPAPALAEGAAGSERSDAGTDLVALADATADPVQVIPQDSNNDVATHKGIGETSGGPRSAHRKHGGAVPK
jgi:Protein of unknown function (DUF3306)